MLSIFVWSIKASLFLSLFLVVAFKVYEKLKEMELTDSDIIRSQSPLKNLESKPMAGNFEANFADEESSAEFKIEPESSECIETKPIKLEQKAKSVPMKSAASLKKTKEKSDEKSDTSSQASAKTRDTVFHQQSSVVVPEVQMIRVGNKSQPATVTTPGRKSTGLRKFFPMSKNK